jgi:hypothetical protein
LCIETKFVLRRFRRMKSNMTTNSIKITQPLRVFIAAYLVKEDETEASFNVLNYGDFGSLQLILCVNSSSARWVKIYDESSEYEAWHHIDVSEILECHNIHDVREILFDRAQSTFPKAEDSPLWEFIFWRVMLSEAFKAFGEQRHRSKAND